MIHASNNGTRTARRLRVSEALAAAALSLVLGTAGSAKAADTGEQSEETENDEAELEPTTFGVGLQSSWPSFGFSGTMDLDDSIAVQGVLGLFGRVSTFAGRGLYRFAREEMWSVYGYGSAGAISFRFLNETETSLGLGAGVGLEYDWRAWQRKLPPIRWNIEIGLGYADLAYYDYTGFTFGAGLHYRL